MVPSGIPALDALTGGLPRGCLTEIYGPASSGRTTVLLAALAAATRRGEYCVLVDSTDALDPLSATAAGVDLDRLLWVRCSDEGMKSAGAPPLSRTLRQGGGVDLQCQLPLIFQKSHSEHRLEQVLRTTDLLLESGGFGLIILDLADLPPQSARRIPLTTWFRFRRAVEHKPTILLAIEQQPIAGSCSSLLLQLGAQGSELPESTIQDCNPFNIDSSNSEAAKRRKNAAHGASRGLAATDIEAPEGRKKICTGDSVPTHAQLLTGLGVHAELILSRLNRKPSHSITFESKTAWAG
jgi:hypothetical protein